MIVCIDTSVLVQARAASHLWNPILRACAFGKLTWAVSNQILTEYREMITLMNGTAAWGRMSQLLDLIAASGGLHLVTPHFQFGIVTDNAFTDCAITVGADYLITPTVILPRSPAQVTVRSPSVPMPSLSSTAHFSEPWKWNAVMA